MFQALRPWVRAVSQRPLLVLGLSLLLSAYCLSVALNLRIDTDFSKLLPEDYVSVKALERLRATVGGESTVDMIIESPSFAADTAFVNAFLPRALGLAYAGDGEPYLTRAEFRKDVTFLQNNALYFTSEDELDELETYLREEIENARLDANPFFFDLEEEDDTTEAPIDFDAAYRQIVPNEYPISEDSTTMVVQLYPAGAQTNIGRIEAMYNDFKALSDELDPASYHPEMQVYFGGRPMRQVAQVRSITRDVTGSFMGGVSTVLFIIMLYFAYKAYQGRGSQKLGVLDIVRMPLAALLLAIPLGMSLTWTFAIAYAAFGILNLMTSILVLVLFGLGVDYGIHFYARYAEERTAGRTVQEAIEETFVSTGPPIAVSALTTAISLLVLIFADFKGFSQFGFIAGVGIILALLSMLFILPALIVLFERWHLVKVQAAAVDEPQADAGTWRFPWAKPIVGLSLVAVVLGLVFANSIHFEYQFGKLDPVFTEYNDLNAKVRTVFPPSKKRNPAYVVVDTPEDVPVVTAALWAHAAADSTPTILDVESLQERFPMRPAQQQRRLARIDTIRALLEDPFLKASNSEDLARIRQAAQTRSPISEAQVPDYLKARFSSKDGEIGQFVIVYPTFGLDDGRNSMAFAADVGTITAPDGRTFHAGSTPIVAATMLRLMLRESPWMVLFTAVVLALLMFLVFRSLRWTLLAALPLVVGILWMMGIMELFDVKLNFYNLIVLPAVLGIGNDTGVHLIYRYREEGPGSLRRVLRSTGEHITIGALTTMIGFAWWMFSFHPGLNTIGVLAVIGIGAVLLAALLFLPALLQLMEDRAR